jgi:hypothetical protein
MVFYHACKGFNSNTIFSFPTVYRYYCNPYLCCGIFSSRLVTYVVSRTLTYFSYLVEGVGAPGRGVVDTYG